MAHDPLVLRFAQLTRLPDIPTLSRWLGSLTAVGQVGEGRLAEEAAELAGSKVVR